MQIVVLMGPPAAGKGTQAAFLEQQGFFTFSTGHYIREQAAKGDPECIKALERKGKLASDDLVIRIVRDFISEKLNKGVKGIVLDGFPRTVAQAEELEKIIAQQNITLTAIEIVADEDVLNKRRQARYDAAVAAGQEPRKDDKLEIFRERMKEYWAKTAPVTPFYRALGKLRQVDGLPAPEIVRGAVFGFLGLRVPTTGLAPAP